MILSHQTPMVLTTPVLLPAPATLIMQPGAIAIPAQVTIWGADSALLTYLRLQSQGWATATNAAASLVTISINPQLGAQAYHLDIDQQVTISAGDLDGCRYALCTLLQLIQQYTDHLPRLAIADAPVFTNRGVMIDISRDRVPTMADLRVTIAQLASWKINHLQLYTEHTFAYTGHETVWKNASPFTAAELDQVQTWCSNYGITLVANQNCFGHMERWLKHDAYRHLAEAEEWTAFGTVRKYPFTLTPTDPGSLALVDDILHQLIPHFTSSMVNIGCDETFDLGQGKSRAACEQRGKGTVYIEFVSKVCAIVRSLGKRPMLWADIALEHPECLQQLPADSIALAWNYEPSAEFAQWCQAIRAVDREVWVCPGTSSWCSITGRTIERRTNLLTAAEQGLANGANGYLVTDWGDLGHRQTSPISTVAVAEAAHRAWSGSMHWDSLAASLHAFHDESGIMAEWLDALGMVDRDLRLLAGKDAATGERLPLLNRTALFHDLHLPWQQTWVGGIADWQHVVTHLEACHPKYLPSALTDTVRRECQHSWQVARFAADRAIARRQLSPPGPPPAELAQRLKALIAEHRALWQLHSRPGGLDDSCAHYERVLADLSDSSVKLPTNGV